MNTKVEEPTRETEYQDQQKGKKEERKEGSKEKGKIRVKPTGTEGHVKLPDELERKGERSV